MDEPPRSVNVTAYRLTRAVAEARIRSLAADSDNVIFGTHCLERMDQRGIVDTQVLEILRTGMVAENPSQTKTREWKCKVTKKLRGAREAGAITIILHNGRLFVMTVEWEDIR
jgi:uncharacterized protein DUF4258